jgi:hypothetical protein
MANDGARVFFTGRNAGNVVATALREEGRSDELVLNAGVDGSATQV